MTARRTRGEGRSKSEKAQRLTVSRQTARDQAARRRAEEQEWADRSGPVVVKASGGEITAPVDRSDKDAYLL